MNNKFRSQVLLLLNGLTEQAVVQQMRQYIQHGNVTTYDHCMTVAILSYGLAVSLHFPVNRRRLVTGAFLHDFYLYDWHGKNHGRLHGFRHPQIARENAAKLLNQPREITDIIFTHMWPLTLRRVPTSLEGWIVCMMDKVATIQECLQAVIRTREDMT